MKQRPRTLEAIINSPGESSQVDKLLEELWKPFENNSTPETMKVCMSAIESYASRVGAPTTYKGEDLSILTCKEQETAIKHFVVSLLLGYNFRPETFFSGGSL